MHPLIARYLDLPAAIATLEKLDNETTLEPDEAAFIAAAATHPKARAAVLKARGAKSPSNEAQQQLIVLATRAATSRISLDPMLGPRVTSALAALQKEGASKEEADDLVAQAVLEEAFGYAEDPAHFDAAFLAETLESLVHLASVTQEKLDDWLETFARRGAAGDRALRLKVAELTLEAAWSDGPQPIAPEHFDETIEQLGDTVASSEFPQAVKTLEEFLGFLAEQHVVGAERRARLQQLLTSATAQGPEAHDEALEEEAELDDEG